MYKNYLKRIFDFFLSLFGLILLFPIIVTFSIILFIVNKGKPYFFQSRPGIKGEIFKIIKFKTMVDIDSHQEEDIHSLSRVTKVGAFIRKYSIDEIMQLINVLKGDMSLVGPRPLLMEYLPLYDRVQKKRHDVKPGITGWAQIKGRNAITWTQKFEYDVWYVEKLNFLLDVKIILLTIKKVFIREGVNADDKQAMETWKGNL